MISKEARTELSESTQIRLVLDGNVDAFSDLVEPHRRGLYLKALSIVRSEADAEEIAQNAILKAFNKLSQFRHDSQFRTWLISITINEARMWLRANRKSKHESLDHEDDAGRQMRTEIVDVRENPFQVWERKQVRSAILKAVSTLSSRNSQVFILRDLRLLSISETAKALGISEGKVRTRLRRARLRMREALANLRSTRISEQDHRSTSAIRRLSDSTFVCSWPMDAQCEMESIQ
jgi:RNA polymerase sigma-70 factor (ECF subfamily)